MKTYFLRHATYYKIKIIFNFITKRKQLVLSGSCGSFIFPFYGTLQHSNKLKKLWFLQRVNKSFDFMSHILLMQACVGVIAGYKRQLNIVGVGFQATIDHTNCLVLKLGFSHVVRVKIPSFLTIICPKPRIIIFKGINMHKVTNFMCYIRQLKLPNTYKQKGIYFKKEPLSIKQGKRTK